MEQRTFEEVKRLFHHLINGTMEETDFDVMMDVLRDYSTGAHTVLIPEPVKQVMPEPMPLPNTGTPMNLPEPSSISIAPENLNIPTPLDIGNGIAQFPDDIDLNGSPKRKFSRTQQQIVDIIEKYGHPMKASEIAKNKKSSIGSVSVCLCNMVKTGLLEKDGVKFGTSKMFEKDPNVVDPKFKKLILAIIKKAGRPITESAIGVRIGKHNDVMFMKALRELKKAGKITESDHSGSYILK